MFRYSLGNIALASIFFSTYVNAAEIKLEDTVVTASRTEQKSSEVLGDVSIITEEQIQKAGQTTLLELLNQQPGIEIASNGGVGKSSDIFIRGANPTHTLILVDGVRVSSATTGTTAIQHIPLSQIERVEILRGPASSLYGADAIGGVIQIFTKQGKGTPRFNASVGLGTYGTAIGEAGVSGRIGNTSYSLQGGMTHVHGISAVRNKNAPGYNKDIDGYRNQNIAAKLTQHFGENHEIGFGILISDGRNFNDGTSATTARYDQYIDQTLSTYTVHSKNRFTDYWTSLVTFSRGIDDLTSYSKQPTRTTSNSIKTTQDQYLWQNTLNTSWGTFNLGIERREQKAETVPNALPEDQRNIQSYLVGWQKRFDKHNVQVNLRNDDNSQFGNKTTGSVAYAYEITPRWKANAAYGTAFAAPTFNQLYYPNFGNPNLKPEESRNKEIGLKYDNGNHHVAATYYLNEVDNLIINPRTGNNFTNVAQNVNQARLSGLTLSYQGILAGFNIRANGDFQRPEDADTGNLLPRRAKEHGTFAVSKRIHDWEMGSEIESSSHRYNDTSNTVRMAGYTLVNLYTNYRINDDWSLNARINNLFDRKYELAKDYGTFGANLFVSVRYGPAF
ncbi:TonB-dependent receptor [Methylobacillus arboreus]|uniref:TonB-dependent receptor domain-containing protein n=1 Tax=Methylobacillus arboreus TaxID=755170 RepID=UPI001E2AEEB7|nr:TonB-dependent receptor [Methylobacillus arboreus]MCB5190148.1 TonB-dependent receptor [Methylobacillus arboreus]